MNFQFLQEYISPNNELSFQINICLINNSLFISITFDKTREYFSSCYTSKQLIQLNNHFSKFKSPNELYTLFQNYFNSNNNEKIRIKETTKSALILYCKDLLNETIEFHLFSSCFISKSLTINNNNQITLSSDNILIGKNRIDINSSLQIKKKIYCIYFISFILLIVLSFINFLYVFRYFTPVINEDEMNLISSWINKHKTFKYTLLYRASRDGDSPIDFHNACDNKGPTITVIYTKTGLKFGGYSDIDWESSRNKYKWKHKSSKNAFLFSLNLKQKYPIIQPDSAIFCYADNGPTFGAGRDISITDNFLKETSFCNTPYSYGNMNERNEINGGKRSFIARNIEVYLVEEIKYV